MLVFVLVLLFPPVIIHFIQVFFIFFNFNFTSVSFYPAHGPLKVKSFLVGLEESLKMNHGGC